VQVEKFFTRNVQHAIESDILISTPVESG